MRRRLFLLVLGLGLAFGPMAPARAVDVFGQSEHPAAAPSAPTVELPAPLRPILARALEWQARLNVAMRAELSKARKGGSSAPAAAIVLFAFLYGIAHAVGPGHGKLVIGSYFLTRRARAVHGIAMSAVAALVQALSAIAIVGLLAVALRAGSGAILSSAADIEMTSYGAIALVGLWMAWSVVRGHRHELAPDPDAAARGDWRRMLTTGAVVGLRPCSGAILVLLFCLANGIVAIGVIATFAIALGVAITVSLVSLTTLGLRRSLARLGDRTGRVAEAGYRAAAFGGAVLIALFGLLELVGVLTGALPPMAG